MSKRTKLDTVGLQWPSKRVETLGERKFRDIVGILPQPGHLRDKAQKYGTVPAIPGPLATMCIYITHRVDNTTTQTLEIDKDMLTQQ